jgi:hypothetical protein
MAGAIVGSRRIVPPMYRSGKEGCERGRNRSDIEDVLLPGAIGDEAAEERTRRETEEPAAATADGTAPDYGALVEPSGRSRTQPLADSGRST